MKPVTMRATPDKLKGWPIVGVLPELVRKQLDFWLEARIAHGDVYTINLGASEAIALCHPRHAQHVFADNVENYRHKGGNRGFRAAIRELTNDGLSTAESENEVWRQQRQVIQPYFHHPNLEPLAGLLVEVIDEELAAWEAPARSGRPFDLSSSLSRIAISAIVRGMFGTHIDAATADKLAANSKLVMDAIWRNILIARLPTWMPVPGQRRHDAAIRTVVEIAMNLVDKRLASDRDHEDLISVLVAMRDDDEVKYMTDRLMRDEAVSLLLAGYEIMAVTTQCALDLLVAHPAQLRRARDEVDEVLGARLPTYADVEKLAYCRMVIHETLRMYSPVYQLQRMASEDDEIDGFHIPAGSIVSVLVHAIHHHPEVWERPDRFEPERFSPARSKDRHRLAWLPFGAGRRSCLATRYSIIQGQLVLAQVLQRFDLRAVPERPTKLYMSTVTRPKHGVWVYVDRRTKQGQP